MAAALVAAGCGDVSRSPTVNARPAPTSVVLRGAGPDSLFPIYEEVGSALAQEGITVNYQLSSSSSALTNFRAGRLSFLSAASSRFAGNPPRIGDTSALYVPVGFTAVGVIYDLPSVHARLNLSAKTLAEIFLGQIRKWNNRQIERENPNVTLPATPISLVHSDGPADSTTLFTSYLAAASRRWKRSVGSGPVVVWPGGAAENGDAQIESAVAGTDGAIGYVQQPRSLADGLRTAALLNPLHAYVAPTPRAIGAVGNGPREAGSLSLNTVNTPVGDAYPIASETYVLVYRDLCEAGLTPSKAAATERFLSYLLGPGQVTVRRMSFAPLPPRLRASARHAVHRLSCEVQ